MALISQMGGETEGGSFCLRRRFLGGRVNLWNVHDQLGRALCERLG
jgi:hypothetical protein